MTSYLFIVGCSLFFTPEWKCRLNFSPLLILLRCIRPKLKVHSCFPVQKSPVPLPFHKALTIFEGKSDVGIADNAASNRGTCVAWPLWPLTGFVNRRCYKDLISMVISCTGLKWGQAIWQSGKVILRFWNVLARSDSEVRISRARKC